MTERVERTAEVYNKIAPEYAEKKANQYSEREIQTFRGLLSPGARILSVGGGSGRDEAVFQRSGFQVVSLDVFMYSRNSA